MDNNNLEMSLFGGEAEVELNLDDTPINGDIVTTDTPAAEPAEVEIPGAPPADNINPNEDPIDPESVVGEGQGEGGDDVDSPNLFSSFASTLQEQGVLPSFDQSKNKITDTDGLATVIKSEIDSQVKQYLLNKVGEEGYEALEKGVSLAQYQQHVDTTTNLSTITEEAMAEDLDLAKRVILQDYINQGLTEDKAKRILQKTVDLGEDSILEDSKESIESLKAFEAQRMEQVKADMVLQQAQQVRTQEKIDNDLKSAIYTDKEFIPGIKSNKVMQDKVYSSITKIVGESPQGVMENKLMQDRREDPVEFDAKLYYLYELTDGFSDFSKITKNAATQVVSDFEKVLRMTKFEDSGTPSYMEDKDSYDNLGTELVFE